MLPPGLGGFSIPPQLTGARVYASRAFSQCMPLELSQRSAIQWTDIPPLPAFPTPPCLCFWVKVLWSPDLGTPRCHEPASSLSPSPQVLASYPGHP